MAGRLRNRWHDLPRHDLPRHDLPRRALEALTADAYRQGVLTAAEVQRTLGLESRFDTDAFLEEAGADLGYSWQDLEEDLHTYREASRR